MLVGDSMGGSACLLFSHLASQVLAFVPQLDIRTCGLPLAPRAHVLPRSAWEGAPHGRVSESIGSKVASDASLSRLR